MRKGMTPYSLKKFMLEQGPSKNTNMMEWDKIWAYNKEFIDPRAPRYTAISKDASARLIVTNGPDTIQCENVPLHQKNADLGTKPIFFGKELMIEEEDAKLIEVNQKVTLMKWANINISKKSTGADGKIVLEGAVDLEDKDMKKTMKITWIAVDPNSNVEINLVNLDQLITKDKISPKFFHADPKFKRD